MMRSGSSFQSRNRDTFDFNCGIHAAQDGEVIAGEDGFRVDGHCFDNSIFWRSFMVGRRIVTKLALSSEATMLL